MFFRTTGGLLGLHQFESREAMWVAEQKFCSVSELLESLSPSGGVRKFFVAPMLPEDRSNRSMAMIFGPLNSAGSYTFKELETACQEAFRKSSIVFAVAGAGEISCKPSVGGIEVVFRGGWENSFFPRYGNTLVEFMTTREKQNVVVVVDPTPLPAED